MQQNVVSLPITNSECDSPNSVKNRGDFSALELRFSCLNSSKSALRFSFVNFQVKVYSDRAASDCCNKTKKKENTTCYMSVIWPVKRKLYFWLQNTAKSKATNPFSVSTGFVNSQMLGGGKKKRVWVMGFLWPAVVGKTKRWEWKDWYPGKEKWNYRLSSWAAEQTAHEPCHVPSWEWSWHSSFLTSELPDATRRLPEQQLIAEVQAAACSRAVACERVFAVRPVSLRIHRLCFFPKSSLPPSFDL